MYNKQVVRRWVKDTIRLFMEDEKVESKGPGMVICYEDNLSNSMHSKIYIKENVNGKLVTRATFSPCEYYNGQWDMITTPWIQDLINDVVDAVMPLIQE